MADSFDVIIIGGGPGGYNCAIRAAQLGLKTAIVEKRGRLGGTCLNVGCIPSKALLHASEAYEAATHHFADMGIDVKSVSLNLPKMLAQKDEAVDGLTKGVEFLMKKNKITYLVGTGAITGPGAVSVTDADGKVTSLLTKNIVIATGSDVMSLPGVTLDEERIVSSTGALKLSSVPKKMIVIGGGYIGLEMGSVWRRLGAHVTVVEFLDRITPTMDGEVSTQFLKLLKKQGIVFELGTKVTKVEKVGKGVKLEVEPAAGGPARTLEADVVLISIGRKPYTEGLGLETVGITTDARGFIPAQHWATSAPGVYVIGDVTFGPMLAHKAEEEGAAVAEIIAGKSGHVNFDVIPGVVYTNPEVASVGKTEEELKATGTPYKVGKFPFMANSRARTNHETDGFVKILEHSETRKILGVHMIGVGVGEMIGEACLAMEFGASAEDIARTCHAHPTMSEALREAGKAVDGWVMQL
ncbi:dihydrolipoyl dehydrogenase [Candidatus Phycosocius spiralis]|uniref:Dihydrolipoyl dehydrogenase n=1 Tax=Candidatus Phycosocius spiralis TaxID=2815099 RepID=A0ABQ4PVJ7_9PROT|nr:dihydrolipoyl dehydrogenase [Candidatus Phycosocius spiralis]GIU67052.1 dihydrolipoyl dehydrogenase [Candidatus Phycosocius spiralis]